MKNIEMILKIRDLIRECNFIADDISVILDISQICIISRVKPELLLDSPSSNSNFLGVPTFLISTLSSSVSPSGTSAHGILGTLRIIFCISSSMTLIFSSNSLIF